MAFTNMFFIGRFLPIFLIVYYLAPSKFRDAILFIGSILFYAYGDKKMALLLVILTIINYYIGLALLLNRGMTTEILPTVNSLTKRTIEPPIMSKERILSRKVLLSIIVCIDALVLITFKVLTYHSRTFFLPLGISFYIFKMISYQADLYMGVIKVNPTFVRTAAYFTMFPQIAEGPIMQYEDGDFSRPRGRVFSLQKFEDGVVLSCIGIAMKVLLADRIGILWNEILKVGYENISTPLAWLGAFSYTFQLYFDFWGYSLIASGIGMMLGFKNIINFNHPYAAADISDFYRRWHATLGTWFKNYIYFPLGGSRRGKGRTILNLLIVWAITGLWHGGDINFLIWGLVLGIFIILEKFVFKDLISHFPILGHLNVFIIIPLTWVIFAISDLHLMSIYFARLFPFFNIGKALIKMDYLNYLKIYWPYFTASIILCIPFVYNFIYEKRKNPLVIIFLLALFLLSMYYAVSSQGNAFMYFSF